MAKIVVEEQKEFPVLPADSIVELLIVEANIETATGNNGNSWEKVAFKFKITGIQALGDGSQDFSRYDGVIGEYIYGSCSANLTNSPENKLRLWGEAILGVPMGVGFELDTDNFVRRTCRGITRQYDAKAKDANGIPFKRHGIESILPSSAGQQMLPPQTQAQPQMATSAAAPANDPWGDTWDDEPPF